MSGGIMVECWNDLKGIELISKTIEFIEPGTDYLDDYDGLEDFGWKLLGEGVYARVYENSQFPNIVLRISERLDNYEKYLEYGRRSKNPIVPVSHAFFRDEHTSVNFMERLEELDEEHPCRCDDDYESYQDSLEIFFNAKDERVWRREAWIVKALDLIFPTFNWAADDVEDLRLHNLKEEWDFNDLHGWNLMCRGDVCVITDPIA